MREMFYRMRVQRAGTPVNCMILLPVIFCEAMQDCGLLLKLISTVTCSCVKLLQSAGGRSQDAREGNKGGITAKEQEEGLYSDR
jgi:hypothetical protein